MPPKTTISQQLLRLEDSISPPLKLRPKPPSETKVLDELASQSKQLREENSIHEDDEDGDEEEKEGDHDLGIRGFGGRPRLDVFTFGENGPYEPLVLSSPGEDPLVQVNFSMTNFNPANL